MDSFQAKYANMLTQVPQTMDVVPVIHQAFDIANQVNLNPGELEALERQDGKLLIDDQQGIIIKANREGREEGREEAVQAVARQLLDRLDDETISQTTGLSIEGIRGYSRSERTSP